MRTGAELPGTRTGIHRRARGSEGSDSSGQGWGHRRGHGRAPNKDRAFARSTCVAWKQRDIGRTGRRYRLALCLVLRQRGRCRTSTGRRTDKVSVRVPTGSRLLLGTPALEVDYFMPLWNAFSIRSFLEVIFSTDNLQPHSFICLRG